MKALAIAAAIFITVLGTASRAQTPDRSVPASHSGKSRAGDVRQTDSGTLADALAAAQDQVNIPTQPAASNGPASKAQADYNEAYWKYQRDAIEQTRKVYAWQHVSSIIIFYVVIFLVLVGVLFSWLQFKAAAYTGESEELDASMKGVKITSSTLGVVILVLSMCFFYLYLRYVYPINVNEGTKMVKSSE
ncbi:MAG TPA: hypothetical protein VK798_00035 [Alloacidobacterium sp.]|jgi:hypothetical protein|nr:hypothetical protein [Alloacidobacterium sp.]